MTRRLNLLRNLSEVRSVVCTIDDFKNTQNICTHVTCLQKSLSKQPLRSVVSTDMAHPWGADGRARVNAQTYRRTTVAICARPMAWGRSAPCCAGTVPPHDDTKYNSCTPRCRIQPYLLCHSVCVVWKAASRQECAARWHPARRRARGVCVRRACESTGTRGRANNGRASRARCERRRRGRGRAEAHWAVGHHPLLELGDLR